MHLPKGILPVTGERARFVYAGSQGQIPPREHLATFVFENGESLLILTGVGCEREEHRHKNRVCLWLFAPACCQRDCIGNSKRRWKTLFIYVFCLVPRTSYMIQNKPHLPPFFIFLSQQKMIAFIFLRYLVWEVPLRSGMGGAFEDKTERLHIVLASNC